jgi:uncharacterized membrane protein YfcA
MYGLVSKKPVWFWLAVLWHTIVDAAAVYLVQNISMLTLEGIVGVFALISLGVVIWMKPKFESANTEALNPLDGVEQAAGQV